MQDTPGDLLRFVQVVLSSEEGAQCSQTERLLVGGVVDLEIARLCQRLSYDQVASAGKALRSALMRAVQRELSGFGVHVYDVSVTVKRRDPNGAQNYKSSAPECVSD